MSKPFGRVTRAPTESVSCGKVRYMRNLSHAIGRFAALFGLALAAQGGDAARPAVAPDYALLYKPQPIVLSLGQFDAGYDEAAVTDLALGDFDGDGRLDIAVAWFATDTDDFLRNVRKLTVFFNAGASFVRAADVDLYVPDLELEMMSVFYIGTSSLGIGDCDGDGDLDLAVMPYFGDEIWVIENLGNRSFTGHLKLPYNMNTTGNPLTPPKVLAADFDLNGRNEFVYVCDPTAQYMSRMMHFWQATGTLANMRRVDWLGSGSVATWFVRGLAVADFDGDGRPDLCYTGALNSAVETNPVLTFWCNLNPGTRRFAAYNFYPNLLCSDVVAVRPTPASLPGIVLSALDGTRIQYWTRAATSMQFTLAQEVTGYAGAPDRGLAAAVADVDGDGDLDLVTKLRQADASNAGQIEFTLWDQVSGLWTRVASRVDTTGFTAALPSPFLRPGNLAVGDLLGNSLPEVVAGFAATDGAVRIAIWPNGCLGDVNRDGVTSYPDLLAQLAVLGAGRGGALFNPDADLDKDGRVTMADVHLLLGDFGSTSAGAEGHVAGDINCDGVLSYDDINVFVLALAGQVTYEAAYPNCHWLYADINGDGVVDGADVNAFVLLLALR
jgi:hypothetical protein